MIFGLAQTNDRNDPFKSLILKADLQCLIREIKPRMKQKDCDCTYARSDGRDENK